MKTLLTLTALVLLATPSLQAFEGTRGGGNMEVAAFYLKAELMLNSLLPQSPLNIADTTLDIQALIEKLDAVKVESVTTPLMINGALVDAVNYPDQNLIQFNYKRWLKMSKIEQGHLVIHELLGVARIPDPNYQVSMAVIKYIAQQNGYNSYNADEGPGALSLASTVYAQDCKQQALKLAKMTLDSKAQALGFRSSDIMQDSLKKTGEDKITHSKSFTVFGSIYKADYTVEMTLDSLCSLESLKIYE